MLFFILLHTACTVEHHNHARYTTIYIYVEMVFTYIAILHLLLAIAIYWMLALRGSIK